MAARLLLFIGLAVIADAEQLMARSNDHPTCHGAQFEIRLQIENVAQSAGMMVAELYPDKEEGFLSGGTRVAIARVAARAPQTAFCLTAPGPGDYAVSAYQDENANTDFDRTFLGLPKEPWGISNNPHVGLSGPRLKDSLFEVDANGADLNIRLRH
jgi:uncharacterized protein (DUF2141 family)